MGRGKQLVKNTLIISLGTIVPKFLATISLPIITAGLTKTEYGTYDLVNILETLLLPFITLQVHAAAFRFLIECRTDEGRKKNIVSTMVIFILTSLLIFLFILFCCLKDLNINTRILVCLYFLFNTLALTYQQIVRGLDRMQAYSVSAIVQSSVNVTLIVFFVKYKEFGLNGALVALCCAYGLSGLYLLFREGIYKLISFKSFSPKLLKEMIAYSWPMIPNSLSMWVMGASDRVVLSFFMGVEANAVYAVASKIPSLFTVVQSTFNFAWQENASIASKDNDVQTYYSSVFDVIYSMMIGLLAILIAATPILFALLIRGDYEAAYYQMPILFLAVFFSCMVAYFGGIYIAHKKTKSVGITTTIAAIINLILDISLVNVIGIYAASISTVVSYMFLTVYRIIDIRKFQPMRYKWKKIIGSLLVIVIMCWMSYINSKTTTIVNIFLGIVFALAMNINIIHPISKKIIQSISERMRR